MHVVVGERCTECYAVVSPSLALPPSPKSPPNLPHSQTGSEGGVGRGHQDGSGELGKEVLGPGGRERERERESADAILSYEF